MDTAPPDLPSSTEAGEYRPMGRGWTGWGPATRAFQRLSQLGSTVKERALPMWKSAVVHFAHGRQWLISRRRMAVWTAGISIAVALFIGFVIEGGASWYGKHHDAVAPL